ncbi:Abscisic acid cluster transcription factor abl7 like protein [Verticillium longisporum]|uniref:Abscisic acid cluster transcription factor abl7 like protein n=1 Tax=Verticillium longisporum TaxID=100787 RepID=A0A8I2Z6M0_VERLO|nr:Abscisic acid cluster transcription factor abl7 like protein [Verticillium longisporum]
MNGLQAIPQAAAMTRPQVGIERLPTRRMSNEPRESMNCKSCRKRKIKCNRLRPACEACQVFQCPCIYDAVPKKRGPKTDVLEALLKRVDGLEAKLKEKNAGEKTPTEPTAPGPLDEEASSSSAAEVSDEVEPKPKRLAIDTMRQNDADESAVYSPAPAGEPSPPTVQPDTLLDTYFARFHAKPFHILDESSVRQRLQLSQLPGYLVQGICAVAARYTPHPGGYQAAVKLSEDYAARSRIELDTDEPSVDALQALLLLVIAFTAAGKGKKAYMLMSE